MDYDGLRLIFFTVDYDGLPSRSADPPLTPPSGPPLPPIAPSPPLRAAGHSRVVETCPWRRVRRTPPRRPLVLPRQPHRPRRRYPRRRYPRRSPRRSARRLSLDELIQTAHRRRGGRRPRQRWCPRLHGCPRRRVAGLLALFSEARGRRGERGRRCGRIRERLFQKVGRRRGERRVERRIGRRVGRDGRLVQEGDSDASRGRGKRAPAPPPAHLRRPARQQLRQHPC